MALIHPRVARNFIKNGYFPTDEPTLERIASALEPAVTGCALRALDPCCGEGAALATLANHLQACGAGVNSYGVELDEERAWHAKTLLGTVAHADVHDVRISERSFGLLFLNPPYGDLVADAAHTGSAKEGGRQRHEKIFCRRSFNLLQPGGVLVLIVPFYMLDADLSTMIARHFERVQVCMSPEQQFKQCVLFGVKRRPGSPDAALIKRLVAFAEGQEHQELPERWPEDPRPRCPRRRGARLHRAAAGCAATRERARRRCPERTGAPHAVAEVHAADAAAQHASQATASRDVGLAPRARVGRGADRRRGAHG
jgi:tRNA1(Val) A37 N6-methylase TrmN6